MAEARAIDRRPQVVEAHGRGRVEGWRCQECRYPIVQPVPRCPECGSAMSRATFGPAGVVRASTCLRVRVPGYQPPYAIAYVDLEDGPRVLVHSDGDVPLPLGARVFVTGTTAEGDIAVREAGAAGEESACPFMSME